MRELSLRDQRLTSRRTSPRPGDDLTRRGPGFFLRNKKILDRYDRRWETQRVDSTGGAGAGEKRIAGHDPQEGIRGRLRGHRPPRRGDRRGWDSRPEPIVGGQVVRGADTAGRILLPGRGPHPRLPLPPGRRRSRRGRQDSNGNVSLY